MSLDISIVGEESEEACMCDCGNQHIRKTRDIFIFDKRDYRTDDMEPSNKIVVECVVVESNED